MYTINIRNFFNFIFTVGNKKSFALLIVALIFPLCGYAASDRTSKQGINDLQPQCLEYCTSIKEIFFTFIDKTDNNLALRKNFFLNRMENLLKRKNQENSVNIIFIKLRDPVNYFFPAPTRIKVQLYFYYETYSKSSVVVDVKVVAPNQFYAKQITCDISKNFSCIDQELNEVTDKIIGDYLFKPVIGSVK